MVHVDVRAWAVWKGFVVDSGTGIRDGQVGEEAGGERLFGSTWCVVVKSGLENSLAQPEKSPNKE